MVDIKKAKKLYNKSIEVLESVQSPNGGCLATPKGERYPYIYPRDHAIVTLGFLSAGRLEKALKAIRFIFKTQYASGAFPQRLTTKGEDASYKPIQLDSTGLSIYALATYVKLTNDLSIARELWPKLKKAARYIIKNVYDNRNLLFTQNSVHEFPPIEKGLEIWSNSICCIALHRMYELGLMLGKKEKLFETWHRKIKKGILTYMWNSRKKTFVKTIRVRESSSVIVDPDPTKYATADFALLPDSDLRVKSTVRDIETYLWHKKLGGICRYPKYEGRNNGGWGPWPNYTLMISRHYIRTGNYKKFEQYLNWVLGVAYKGLLPEHISTVREFEEYVTDFSQAGLLRKDRLVLINNARKHPMFKKGIAYITTPLAWPHAEFIRTWNCLKRFMPERLE